MSTNQTLFKFQLSKENLSEYLKYFKKDGKNFMIGNPHLSEFVFTHLNVLNGKYAKTLPIVRTLKFFHK